MNSFACIRRLLCGVNLLFWLLGCGMLGVGLWMNQAYRGYSKLLLSHQALGADSCVITAGVLMFLLGFLGCCGSWFQNKCLLRVYFIMVICVLLLESTAGTLGFLYRRHVSDALQDELFLGMQKHYTVTNDHGLKDTWDNIQIQFECCGVRSYKDWYHIAAWPDKKWVPASCCLPKFANVTSCGQNMHSSYIFLNGCYPKLHSWLMERLYIVGIVSVAFAFIQLFGIISALIIVCSLSGGKRR